MGQELTSRRPCFVQDLSKVGVRRIAARDPDNLGRRAMHPDELHEIAILRQDHRAGGSGGEEDLRIFLVTQPKVLQRSCFQSKAIVRATGPGPERTGRQPRSSRGEDWMVESVAREAKAGRDVLWLQIWQLFEYLHGRKAIGHQIEDVHDPNAHAPDTRATAALERVDGDSVGNISHYLSLGQA